MPHHPLVSEVRIVRRRQPPGLLLFGANGKLLFLNQIARRILFRKAPARLLDHQLNNAMGSDLIPPLKTILNRRYWGPSRARPPLRMTFYSGQRRYALRAFSLDHPSGKGSHPVVILLERINSRWLDFSKAQHLSGLSQREMDVTRILKTGMTDKEIASDLGIATETVRVHLKNIRAKLCVSTRTGILNKLLSILFRE